MEKHLRQALKHGELRVFYLPQINLYSEQIVAAKALLRWQRPDVGWVVPDQFFPLTKEAGLITAVGEWLLREACAQCLTWQQKGWKRLRVAVKLSAQQFRQADLSGVVANILKETGLEPCFLDLELTEDIAMQSVETSLETLTTLKRCGMQLSIDNFGTGYSSLSYLKQFPIDRLKIDRSFISSLTSDPNNAAITAAIIAIAHSLGLEVIAKGVETDEQLKFLKMHGCSDVQGYLLNYPVPADRFTELLRGLSSEKSA